MRRFIVFAVLMSAVLLGCSEPRRVDDNKGKPLYQLDGKPFRFGEHLGHWILVNYWAAWCGSCLEEIPAFNVFLKKHPEILIVGVNADGLKGEALKKAIQDAQIAYPVLEGDPSPQLQIADVSGIPITVVVSPDGVITQTLLGVQTEQSLAEAVL